MKDFLVEIFLSSVQVTHPSVCLKNFMDTAMPDASDGKLYILACGKASGAVAAVLENWFSDRQNKALGLGKAVAVTRHGFGERFSKVEVMEAGHPFPDKGSVEAASYALEIARKAGKDDLVWVILSGGASALWCAPGYGLSLAQKQSLTKGLLKSGATIHDINCVRRYVSEIKGGGLLEAAFPARVLTTAISDVVGDDIAVIGSGPTVYDRKKSRAVREVLQGFNIGIPPQLQEFLDRDENTEMVTGVEQPVWANNMTSHILASGQTMLEKAAILLENKGYRVISLGDGITGEARDIALDHAKKMKGLIKSNEDGKLALLSGGEVTVTVRGNGQGGSSQEYALALAIALGGQQGVCALVADSDGIDGGDGNPDDPAGAFIDSSTLARAARQELCPATFLENNDSGGFFKVLGDLVVTGSTQTNVNDFRLILYDGGNRM